MDTPLSFGKLLVISPHLDDAVFSCSELLARHAGTLVTTVFSSVPEGFHALTDWDAASGFLSADEAVSARKQEDFAALHMLAAIPQWLDFFDSQYGDTPALETIASSLQDVIEHNRPETIVFPAGLFHSDHLLVHRAMLAVRNAHLEKNWIMYEDAPYRCVAGALQKRLAQLLDDEIEATPLRAGSQAIVPAHLKQQAVHCYASQLRALSRTSPHGSEDIFSPERYWQLKSLPTNADEANVHDRY